MTADSLMVLIELRVNAGAVLHHHLHLSVFSDVMICRQVI